MQRDAQAVIIDRPEELENEFRLHARVDENKRQPMRLDGGIDSPARMLRGMPRQGMRSRVSRMLSSGGFAMEGSACTRSAGISGSPESQRCRSSGWRTVADRPKATSPGRGRAAAQNQAPADRPVGWAQAREARRRSPCATRRTTPPPRRRRAGAPVCSGDVSRMSGGSRFCRSRRDWGVSPVRVSTRTGRPMPAIGASRLRAISTASAFKGEI